MGIATKFAKWDVPALATLKGCKAYRNSYFRRGIPVMGWKFDFTDAVHLYWVKQFRQIHEYYAIDKTSLRAILFGKVDEIVELI